MENAVKIAALFKYHWQAIFLALIFGAMLTIPFLSFQIQGFNLGTDILNELTDDDYFYQARIKEVMDGYSTIGNAYIWEHKDSPHQQFLAEYILAQPLRIFGLNEVEGRFLYSLILPAISFLLSYLILYSLYPSRSWALFFNVLLFFGLYLNKFLRPISPQFNFIFWLSQFYLLILLIKSPHSKKIWLFNSLNLGFLIYLYPYYWTFFMAYLGLLFIIDLVIDRKISFHFITIIAGSFLVSTFYFLQNLRLWSLPEYQETLARIGFIYTRFPSGIKIIAFSMTGILIFVTLVYKKILSFKESRLFLAGFITAIIATNQHIITGRNMEFSSHFRMLTVFLFVFAVYYAFMALADKVRNFKIKLIGGILIGSFLLVNFYSQFSFLIEKGKANYNGRYTELLIFINTLEKDSVIYANEELSKLVPVYSDKNVFFTRNANLFVMSDKEVLDRFILNNFFVNYDREFVIQNFRPIFGTKYLDMYGHTVMSNKLRKVLGLQTKPEVFIPDDAVNRVIDRAKYLKKSKLQDELNKYRVDYVIIDKELNSDWEFNNHPKIFENSKFIVYKF